MKNLHEPIYGSWGQKAHSFHELESPQMRLAYESLREHPWRALAGVRTTKTSYLGLAFGPTVQNPPSWSGCEV